MGESGQWLYFNQAFNASAIPYQHSSTFVPKLWAALHPQHYLCGLFQIAFSPDNSAHEDYFKIFHEAQNYSLYSWRLILIQYYGVYISILNSLLRWYFINIFVQRDRSIFMTFNPQTWGSYGMNPKPRFSNWERGLYIWWGGLVLEIFERKIHSSGTDPNFSLSWPWLEGLRRFAWWHRGFLNQATA